MAKIPKSFYFCYIMANQDSPPLFSAIFRLRSQKIPGGPFYIGSDPLWQIGADKGGLGLSMAKQLQGFRNQGVCGLFWSQQRLGHEVNRAWRSVEHQLKKIPMQGGTGIRAQAVQA
jgi:hypothetical protein